MVGRRRKKVANSKTTGGPQLNLVGNAEEINAILDSADSQSTDDTVSQPQLPTMSAMLVDQHDLDDLGIQDEDLDVQEDLLSITSDVSEQETSDSVPAKIPKRDSKGRGRAVDSIWEDFHSSPTLAKTKVQCNYCGTPVSKKVERLHAHINKNCKVKAKVAVPGRKSVPEPTTSLPSEDVSCVQIVATATRKTQSKMINFVDKISKNQQEKLNIEIGKYIFSTNLSFSHVENPAFKRMIRMFRPAYVLPSRRTIGNRILNKVYSEVMGKQDEELKGKSVTIMQDGWKTRTSEPVISHSITTGEKSYFFNAINAEENKKTAEYCCQLLAKTIQEVKDLGADVVAVVTDNCASMVRMRELIEIDFPDIFTYGCHVHLLNLVGKKFTPDDIICRVREVHTFFRSHDAAWALLKKQKCGRPILPHDIRWNAWIECLEYFLKHQTKMLEVSRIPAAKCTDRIQVLISDAQFYSDVKKAATIMKPVQVFLDKLQRENATLADGVDAWVSLESTLDFRDLDLKQYFDEQFEKAVQPVGIAAHMLHPTYRGRGLGPDLLSVGNTFLAKRRPLYVVIAAQLRDKNDTVFPSHMFTDDILKNSSPSSWWNTLECLEKIDREGIKFASKLMNLPAGSADIERHFSILGNIMGVRRSRLGLNKAAKLCVIYKHLAGRDAPGDDGGDWDIPEDED